MRSVSCGGRRAATSGARGRGSITTKFIRKKKKWAALNVVVEHNDVVATGVSASWLGIDQRNIGRLCRCKGRVRRCSRERNCSKVMCLSIHAWTRGGQWRGVADLLWSLPGPVCRRLRFILVLSCLELFLFGRNLTLPPCLETFRRSGSCPSSSSMHVTMQMAR
uniref:Uncharacterized protein n=1 Tax=Setaria italica TaxID=4555 RepID=K3YW93_SETIT